MKPHILVVDDEIRYQHLLRVNLESEGYEISTAGDGEQAIEMIANRRPDMVILDVMMPRLDGYSTCERIRQFSSVPIIMLTGKAEEDDRVRGLNAGADDYVAKPFSATELVARVRAVLRRAVIDLCVAKRTHSKSRWVWRTKAMSKSASCPAAWIESVTA